MKITMDSRITMSLKEIKKYDIIKKAISGEINGSQAAELLNLTVRHIRRLKNKVNPAGKKEEEHREWPQRKASYGEMIQYDGSYEHWFEDRGGESCLLASIEDANSKVSAKFDEHEGVEPTF